MKKRGVTVIVVCDDEDVPEYATQHIDSGRVTSFIASEVGKRFVLEVVNDTDNGFMANILCDGALAGSWFLDPHEQSGLWDGVLGEGTAVRPFLFSRLPLSDADADNEEGGGGTTVKEEEEEVGGLVTDKEDGEEQGEGEQGGGGGGGDQLSHRTRMSMGIIDVWLYRSSLEAPDPTRPPREIFAPHLEVDETSNRGGITLGDPIDGGPVESVLSTPHYAIDPREKPYARFSWCYRPKEYLQAQGIIRPPGRRGRGRNSKSDVRRKQKQKQGTRAGKSALDIKLEAVEVDDGPEDLMSVLYLANLAAAAAEDRDEHEEEDGDGDGEQRRAKRPRVEAGSSAPARRSERLRSRPPRSSSKISP
ncbi:hypothetical protein BDW22DRAFT_421977 [Trametopsis cervina]|nr:hypothetical protein BDW22DRAFT_421977 [Trametopsis cervina]